MISNSGFSGRDDVGEGKDKVSFEHDQFIMAIRQPQLGKDLSLWIICFHAKASKNSLISFFTLPCLCWFTGLCIFLYLTYCDNVPSDIHEDHFITSFTPLDNRRSPEDQSVIGNVVLTTLSSLALSFLCLLFPNSFIVFYFSP